MSVRVWVVHENQDGYGFQGAFDTEEAARKIDPHLHTTTTYDIDTDCPYDHRRYVSEGECQDCGATLR